MADKDQIKSGTSEDQLISDSAGSVDQPTSEPEAVEAAETQTDEIAEEIPQPDFEPEPDDQQVSESAESVSQPTGEPEVEATETATESDQTPEIASASPSNDEEASGNTEKTETSEQSEVAETTEPSDDSEPSDKSDSSDTPIAPVNDNPNAKWYVVHTFSGHENKVATNLKQRIDSEHLENRIVDILVPTQDKIEIRGGKKEQVKEKIFPGYILVKMDLDDASWLAVRTTQGVTAFVGMNNKPTPISEREVQSIVKFMTQGAPATFKDVFMVDDTVKIIDGPFTDFIGKVESVDKEKGKVRVLVSIFGRETPVELDFLQVTKL